MAPILLKKLRKCGNRLLDLFHKSLKLIEFNNKFTNGFIEYHDGSRADISNNVSKNSERLKYLISKNKGLSKSQSSEKYIILGNQIEKDFIHIESANELEIKDKLLRSSKEFNNIYLPYLIPFDTSMLYDFQTDGVEWLISNDKALLADDMGLGKSVQVIAALSKIFNSNSTKSISIKNTSCLILAPKSLIKNWVDQFNSWAPYFKVLSIVSKSKNLLSSIQYASINYHIVVTNYESVRGNPDILNSDYFDIMVCDEAHRLRKRSSAINKTILQSKINQRWLLTGTPIEKDSLDVLNLASILEPSRISIENNKFSDFKALNLLKKYSLRRTKDELLKDIPKPNEKDVFIDLSSCQRKKYDLTIKDSLKPKNRDLQLKFFNALRSIIEFCPECDENAKTSYVIDLLKSLPEHKRKSIVFSYLLDPLVYLKKYLDLEMNVVILDGSQTASERFEIVERFQTSDDIDIILASIRATSEGLTITAAERVIFLNKWWNPSLNMQARDRVIRLGQKKVVDIFNIYVNDSIDSNLLSILNTKEQTWNKVINKEMSESQIAKLVMNSIVD